MAQAQTDLQAEVALAAVLPRPGLLGRGLRFFRQQPLGAGSAVIVGVLIVVAIFAPLLAPYWYNTAHIAERLQAPSARFLLGTDASGRDLASLVIYGARISIGVGFTSVAVSTALSTLLGLSSGYFQGKVDLLVQRFVDVWLSFPALVLAISLVAVFGQGVTQLILIIGLLLGIGASRVVRSAVLGVINNTYMDAARVLGAGHLRIVVRYVLPNVFPIIIVIATVQLGAAILTEASLSFLGFGVPPPTPSWGQLLSGTSENYMYQAPWLAFFPGLALSLAIFAFNMFGDALRDVLDPRMRGGRG